MSESMSSLSTNLPKQVISASSFLVGLKSVLESECSIKYSSYLSFEWQWREATDTSRSHDNDNMTNVVSKNVQIAFILHSFRLHRTWSQGKYLVKCSTYLESMYISDAAIVFGPSFPKPLVLTVDVISTLKTTAFIIIVLLRSCCCSPSSPFRLLLRATLC